MMVLLVFCWIIPASASNYAINPPPGVGMDISYWYCNTDDVGKWVSSQIDVYVGTNSAWSALSRSNIITYMNLAQQSWNSTTGMSFTYVNNQASADLVVGGITRVEAEQLGCTPSTLGVTFPQTTKRDVTLYYNGAEKNYYSITGCTVYLIESAINGNALTINDYKKVAVHEAGHAFGYLGHYEGGNVMPAAFQNISSLVPNQNEYHHLKQFYG